MKRIKIFGKNEAKRASTSGPVDLGAEPCRIHDSQSPISSVSGLCLFFLQPLSQPALVSVTFDHDFVLAPRSVSLDSHGIAHVGHGQQHEEHEDQHGE